MKFMHSHSPLTEETDALKHFVRKNVFKVCVHWRKRMPGLVLTGTFQYLTVRINIYRKENQHYWLYVPAVQLFDRFWTKQKHKNNNNHNTTINAEQRVHVARTRVHVCVCACVCACVRACVRGCVRACVCMCMCVIDGEGNRMVTSRAIVVFIIRGCVSDRLQWLPDRLQWLPDRLQWLPDRLQWLSDRFPWTHFATL